MEIRTAFTKTGDASLENLGKGFVLEPATCVYDNGKPVGGREVGFRFELTGCFRKIETKWKAGDEPDGSTEVARSKPRRKFLSDDAGNAQKDLAVLTVNLSTYNR